MKKIFTMILVCAAAVLASVSCNKEEVIDASKDGTVRFYANEIKTKTEFGTPDGNKYPTLWTGNEDVYISLNMANSVKASVTPTGSNKTADLTPATDITDDGSGNYVFYAVSPNQVSKINTTYNSWNLEIPANQTPTATSVDEAAQVLFAKESTGSTFPASVGLNFKHVTAYGKLSFTNLALDPGETVTSVVIESPVNWVGRWYYYVEDHDTYKAGDIAPSSASKVLTITTDKTSDIWFACAPVDLRTKTIDITVSTTKGTFSKSVTFPSNRGNFEAGKIGGFTVDMSGVVRAGGVVYTLVDNVADLTLGSEVIIVAAGKDVSLSTSQNTNNRGEASVTKTTSGGKSVITDPSASVQVFTIENGTKAGTYAFSTGSGYIYAVSGQNYLKTGDLEATGSWGIAITSEGVATIKSVGTTDVRTIRYNSSSSLFSCYKSGQNDVSIYKKNGTGSGSITPKVVEGLSIVGATTTYKVNDTYNFDGTVNLVYSDASTESISSSEYTVDDSEVDMTHAGTYTVTVKYNADNNIKDTYDITVSAESKAVFSTADYSGQGTSGSGSAITSTKSNITVASDKGYCDGSNHVRVYSGGKITVTAAGGKTIKKIEITSTASGTSNYGPAKLSAASGYSYSGKVGTWTGSASSVTLNATAQFRFTDVVVTYE